MVYDLGNGYVLKVAKSKNGINSNKREVSAFRLSPLQVRRQLAEIIAYGRHYRWVKMKKYSLRFPVQPVYVRKFRRLITLFRKYGIVPWDVGTRAGKPNYKNLRVKRDGAIVVIDYGNFRFAKNSPR